MWTREGSLEDDTKFSLFTREAHSLPFLYSGASMNGPSLLNAFLPPLTVVILPGPVRIPTANGDRRNKHKTAAKTTTFDRIIRTRTRTRLDSKRV